VDIKAKKDTRTDAQSANIKYEETDDNNRRHERLIQVDSKNLGLSKQLGREKDRGLSC